MVRSGCTRYSVSFLAPFAVFAVEAVSGTMVMTISSPSLMMSEMTPETRAMVAGSFGCARLEDFFDARQTHGDVAARGRDASGVEGTHGELGARLADGLCGDDADRFADVDEFSVREVDAVAFLAHAARDLAGHRRADGDFLDATRRLRSSSASSRVRR